MNGTSEGRYLFELDGVTAVRASEVSGITITHEEFELYESNRPNPHIGRGHYKCEAVNVKHAHALNGTGQQFFQWMSDFIRGGAIERRGARLIVLDEDGESPVAIYELLQCVPTKMQAESQTAGGKNASMFTFSLRPTDMQLI